MTTETLEQWAARVAPTFDADKWRRVETVANPDAPQSMEDAGFALSLLHGGPGDASGYDRSRALLAYRDKVAAELRTPDGWDFTSRRAHEFGVIDGDAFTDFGREIARVLEEKR